MPPRNLQPPDNRYCSGSAPGRKHRLKRRRVLCRQLLQLSGTPLIASLEDFRVTIEIEEA
jgi:hypothetical protein